MEKRQKKLIHNLLGRAHENHPNKTDNEGPHIVQLTCYKSKIESFIYEIDGYIVLLNQCMPKHMPCVKN
jgi:hypothetical protein